MELSGYISLQSFVEGCTGPAGEPALILQAENLLYTVPEEEYQYGLSLLRTAIGASEAQKGIPLEPHLCPGGGMCALGTADPRS